MGLYTEAAEAFRQATQLATTRAIQAQALNGAGLCRARQGRTVEAMKFFGAALKLDPNLAPARLNQAIIAEQNQDAAAGCRLAGDCLESGTQRSEHPLPPVGVDDDLHAVKLRCQGRGDFIPPGSEDQDDLTDSGGLPDLVYEVAQDRFAGAPGQ
jgi:tetratricopeptide (TPR) repeat protein